MAGLSRRQGIVLLVGSILITATFVYPYLLNWGGREPQLSVYDDDWNDLLWLREDLEQDQDYDVSTILSSVVVLEDVEDPFKTLLMVIGNEKGYTDLQLEVITNFVRDGGNLFVAGDFDQSSQLANLFTFDYAGYTLWDENFVGNTSFIRVETELNGTPYQLVFNEPTALVAGIDIPPGKWKGDESIQPHPPLAKSSRHSWLDSDGDGYVSPDDDDNNGKGQFPLIAYASVSIQNQRRGQAFFFADASWLTNSMWDREDTQNENHLYLLHLISTILPDGGTIIFDESIHTQKDFPSSFYQSVLSFYFTLSGDTILIKFLKVITFIIIAFVVIYAFLQARQPAVWRHSYRVNTYTPHPYHYATVGPRLREVFINQLKLKLNLMDLPPPDRPDEQVHYIRTALQRRQVALDAQLSQLLFEPARLTPDQEQVVAQKVLRWEP